MILLFLIPNSDRQGRPAIEPHTNRQPCLRSAAEMYGDDAGDGRGALGVSPGI